MNRVLFLFIVQINFFVFTQTSERYNTVYEKYYRAEKLFQKQQFGAARSEYREFVNNFTDYNNPLYVKALYYEGLSALALYNNDAITLLQDFNLRYPENIFKKEIWFKFGKYYYSKKKHKEALIWFNKLDPQDFNDKEKEEFLFKKGYSFFKEGDLGLARSCFYDVKDGFKLQKEFDYTGEGWGLCNNGVSLIMSNGTQIITFRNPETFQITKKIEVYNNKGPINFINELEFIDGKIYANVWTTNTVIVIDPETGMVLQEIDATNLRKEGQGFSGEVLNGIAHNKETNKTYMTGKNWSAILEVDFIEREVVQ